MVKPFWTVEPFWTESSYVCSCVISHTQKTPQKSSYIFAFTSHTKKVCKYHVQTVVSTSPKKVQKYHADSYIKKSIKKPLNTKAKCPIFLYILLLSTKIRYQDISLKARNLNLIDDDSMHKYYFQLHLLSTYILISLLLQSWKYKLFSRLSVFYLRQHLYMHI